MTHSLTTIPRGAAGTRATLQAMERLASQAGRDPEVVLFAQELVRNGPEYGKMAEVESILNGVRRSMRYTPDPIGVETVKSPSFSVREIRQRGRAVMDCDDASTLTATLIRSVGIPTRFKVIKDSPDEFTHVYLEALVDGGWVAVDPIAREMPLGRGPRGLFGHAYYGGGRMYRGMGASPLDSLTELFKTTATDAATAYAERLKKKVSGGSTGVAPPPRPARVVYQQAPAFPWGKIALVAGLGIGAIVALRMLRKK